MRVIITGNMGYVGSVLVRHLRSRFPDATLIGYDNGYFAHCLTTKSRAPEIDLDQQLFGDIRGLPERLLENASAVIHLAAVSNDPMGNRFEKPTDDINRAASVRLARAASAAGVRNFVFASSCSVYGLGEDSPRKEGDTLNPLTAYARSKIGTESGLAETNLGDMTVTSLRFATACGMSSRLRLDLVLNDFVACAIATKKIEVLSDGTPWRPLIDVHDMARAFEWAATRQSANGGKLLSVNVGSNAWNYQVKDLAAAVAKAIPGTGTSINTEAPADKRSYRVDFGLFEKLAPQHQPLNTLEKSIEELRDGLIAIGFDDPDFRKSERIRLHVLDRHIGEKRLNADLQWLAEARA